MGCNPHLLVGLNFTQNTLVQVFKQKALKKSTLTVGWEAENNDKLIRIFFYLTIVKV